MNSSLFRPYEDFRYLFPPRPEIKTTARTLQTYERMGFWGTPKLNGSNGLSFTHPTQSKMMGRHQDSFTRQIVSKDDLMAVHQGRGWQVLNGEYMNKSKKDGNGQVFNGCFVIFDILVHDGKYLIGSTYEERQELLDEMYSTTPYDEYLDKVSNNIYRVKNFKSNFEATYNKIIKIDMYEGLVCKKITGKLESGYNHKNNISWQIKIRKPTKNYSR